ncbi:hypothetical protein CUMW_133510 [Citrus unshiu]|nr:hypothetical protein CUMW_133510 [Citrus unshiu]
MLEREEEEARSLIFCPLVEMTPCRHRILRYVDVAERRICEIPGPAQSLTSKSPYYPEYQIVSRDELLSNISAIDSSFEHPRTKRDLRDGGRLPTSRDSSVAETNNSQCVSAQEEMTCTFCCFCCCYTGCPLPLSKSLYYGNRRSSNS